MGTNLLQVYTFPQIFKDCQGRTRQLEISCSSCSITTSPTKSIPWSPAVKKKRKLFPGHLPTSLRSVALPLNTVTKCRNINLLPFRLSGKIPVALQLSWALGTTNPSPITVHSEPFYASTFKILTWIFATTTEICTIGRSSHGYPQTFTATDTPPYSFEYKFTQMVIYKCPALAPSLFKANSFGWWVVTHSLEDSDFHGHLPTVNMNQHFL